MPSPVRTLLRVATSPSAFFEERPPARTLPAAAGIVALLAIVLVVAFVLIVSMFAGSIDATVTVDNPDRPPQFVCDTWQDDPDLQLSDSCDAPETIERDGSELLREELYGYLWLPLVAPFVVWLLAGLVLFGAGRLAGGDPSGSGALALAGWAAVPEFVRTGTGLVGVWIALSDVTITDVESGVEVLEAAIAPLDPILLLASLLTLAWQWAILTAGLSRDADLSRGAAGVAVGVPLALFGLIGLV